MTTPNPWDAVPSYLVAADNHSTASGGNSFIDLAKFTAGAAAGAYAGAALGSIVPGAGTVVGSALGAAAVIGGTIIGGMTAQSDGKYIQAAAASGGLSFYNTGVRVSNWFGANGQEIETEKFISDYDKDLGKYYEANKESVDIGGFVVGSFAPTFGAMKAYNLFTSALNTAKMGKLGANFSGATGLLAPQQAKYLQLARAEMGSADAGFSLLNNNMTKAFAVGAIEEGIQGAFASAVVLSTMKASPILSDMDAGDMAKNIAEGAMFGGLIGGVFRGVRSASTARTQVDAMHQVAAEMFYPQQLNESVSVSNKILNELENYASFKAQTPDTAVENTTFLKRRQTGAMTASNNRLLTGFRELSGGDDVVGIAAANSISMMPENVQFQRASLLGVQSIHRVGSKIELETRLAKLTKEAYDPKSVYAMTPEDVDLLNNTHITYLKRTGEGVGGVVSDLAPQRGALSLADTLAKGKEISVFSGKVIAGPKEFKFALDQKWNPLDHTVAENQARTIWALDSAGVKLKPNDLVHSNDLAVLKKAYRENIPVNVKLGAEQIETTLTGESLAKHIRDKTEEMISSYKGEVELSAVNKKPLVYDSLDLSARLDMTVGALEGTVVNPTNAMVDLMATHTGMVDYTARMVAAGKHFDPANLIPTYKEPSWIKIVTNSTAVKDDNGMVLLGMAAVKQNQALAELTARNAVASVVGKEFESILPEWTPEVIKRAEASGPGQAFLKSANNAYDTLGSYAQFVGNRTQTLKRTFNEDTKAVLNTPLSKLLTNSNAAVEASALNAVAASTPEVYVLSPDKKGLILRRVLNEQEGLIANRTVLDPKAREYIPFQNADTAEWVEAHIFRNSARVSKSAVLKSANGVTDGRDVNAFYSIPPDPNSVPFFAFVVDPTVSGTGHVSMIRAGTERELDALISKVQAVTPSLKLEVTAKNTSLKTVTKEQAESYYKALNSYSREDTISENYINAALARSGVGSLFVPRTDPSLIAQEFLNWHTQQDNNLARLAIATRYQRGIAELKLQGDLLTNISSSKVTVGSLAKYTGDEVKNPFVDYIKTALDITQVADTPRWTAWNNTLDRGFSEVYQSVRNAFTSSAAKTIPDLDTVNAIFERAGIKSSFNDAAILSMANSVAPRGDLQRFVQRAGTIMSSLMLRMDPTNAAVNAIGSAILTAPELQKLREFVRNSKVPSGTIQVPGTGNTILSPQKLYANSIKNFFEGRTNGLRDWAKESGFSGRRLQEYEALIDDLAPTLTDTGKDLMSRVDRGYARFTRIADFGEKWTGNSLAEEYNRFISADMARQLTDIGIANGVIEARQAHSIINTFVNRTQGVVQASQKPLMFQGPLGNSIGLFQTYQFNMAQQMLRHIGEGDLKTAGLIVGMQGTIFGLRGLPGFEQINANIIGTMSGNTNNKDLYDGVYGVAGKANADWLMYGVASNAMGLAHPDLKMNLYTRGDINPRFATVVPTSFTDIPVVSAAAKMYKSMKESVQKIGMGGDVWTTVLQGIEHSGVSRPLAGMAIAAQAATNPLGQSYSTSNKGNIIAANDFMTLANLTRIAGAKPFDEAIAVDAAYRLDMYKSADSKKLKLLGETIKTTVIAGSEPSQEQIEGFISKYVSIGGKQENFNRYFIDIMKTANTSQANKIADHLKSPFSQSMQELMDGGRLRDFRNQE